MTRWLLLAASLLLLVPAGCDEKNKGGDDDDNDDESAEEEKKEKKEKSKAKSDGKREVFVNCAEAKRGGYLASAKTSEAKNSVGAITRGAMAAFERESAATEDLSAPVGHQLCKSATPVPASGPPKATKYQSKGVEGQDYETGDQTTGWKCLKFAMSQPQYFQYGYNAGSGYKSTEFGLPDPGPDGFEAWAMGDLDGDGRPSLYVRTGKVNKETQALKMNTMLSCVDPYE
ncbi:MAG: hypothetical protein JRI68_11605 [Deltaproteobacteria bacterium]|nr:hypothetical protein [Deltaproteobacteria bacterium]